jgi:5'-phosphate synthase pdxT subunit
MDIVARRNAFGRQVRSFEADLAVAGIGPAPLRAVFIRAPWVESAGPEVEVLATCEGRIVAARERGVLVTAFHPELTDDTRIHELFVTMIRRREGAAQPRAAGEPGRAVAAPANR